MTLRARLVSAALVLSAALVFSLAGVVSSGATVQAKGRVVSAQLSKTSFKASQAKTVKLSCKISPVSKRLNYLLQMKKGAKWTKVRSIARKGSFKGTYRITVKKLFGSKTVKVGQYRVKISADANSVTRRFKVVRAPRPAPGAFGKTSPANGATGQPLSVVLRWSSSSGAASYEYCADTTDNNACDSSWASTSSATSHSFVVRARGATYYWQVRAKNAKGTTYADGRSWFSFATVVQPTAGFWMGSGSDGVISYVITFDVTSGGTNVTNFGVTFDISACGVAGGIVTATSLFPIASGSFSSTSGSPTFSGSFDTATTAHGTSTVTGYPTSACGSVDLEPADWTATWHSPS